MSDLLGSKGLEGITDLALSLILAKLLAWEIRRIRQDIATIKEILEDLKRERGDD